MKSISSTRSRSTTFFVEPILLIGLAIIFGFIIFHDQTPTNLVVLLEDPKGKTGSVVVSTDAGSQTLQTSGAATGVSSAGERPQKPFKLEKSEINELFGGAIKARPPLPVSFTLYFEPNSSRLTSGAMTDIAKIIREIRRRSVSEVSIIGHADRTGSVEGNVRISLRRADVVREALISSGLKRRGLKVDSFGDRDPVVPTGPGVAEPRNRRVEVVVR